jgi:Fe-S-cluster containining protein
VLASSADDRCVFLAPEGRCRIYSARPQQCITYPFWPEVLATAKAWRREAKRCEGIGRGAVVPLHVIEDALRRAS